MLIHHNNAARFMKFSQMRNLHPTFVSVMIVRFIVWHSNHIWYRID